MTRLNVALNSSPWNSAATIRSGWTGAAVWAMPIRQRGYEVRSCPFEVQRQQWSAQRRPRQRPDQQEIGHEVLPDLNPNIGRFPANSPGRPGRPPVTVMSSHAALMQKAYEIVTWAYPAMNRMPRSQRLILSQRVELTSIRILELAIELGMNDTDACRAKIAREAQKLQLLVRLCKDLSYMNFRSYEHASILISELSEFVKIGSCKKEGKTDGGLQRFVR